MKCIINTIIGLVLAGSLVASFVGYTSNTNAYNATKLSKVNKGINASDVVNALKKEGLPIGYQLVVENDPDKLLGQPGQYTSKVNFSDTTQKENEKVQILNGGSVEVFDNNSDVMNRIDSISKMAKSEPMYDEYDYVQGKIILRLTKNLPSNHVKKYEEALNKVSQ